MKQTHLICDVCKKDRIITEHFASTYQISEISMHMNGMRIVADVDICSDCMGNIDGVAKYIAECIRKHGANIKR